MTYPPAITITAQTAFWDSSVMAVRSRRVQLWKYLYDFMGAQGISLRAEEGILQPEILAAGRYSAKLWGMYCRCADSA